MLINLKLFSASEVLFFVCSYILMPQMIQPYKLRKKGVTSSQNILKIF